MSFPISPSNGQITVVNGITYTYDSSEGSWTRTPFPLGNLTVTGNVTANKVYVTSGLYWSGNGAAFVSGGGGSGEDTVLRANVGAYQIYANANAATQATSINTINANLGAYQLYANANIGTLFLGNASTQANLGAFQTYANANIGTLFLGNASTQANLGAFQTYANANAVALASNINAINANLGAFQLYANANIGTLFLGNASTQANLGAFQTYANANAAAQATSINSIDANLGSFQAYANTKIGNNSNSNLVVVATTTSTSTTTGALVVGGGVGVAGNVVADKFYTATGIYWTGNGDPYGAQFTASATAPSNPSLGSYWYKTDTDVIYEYINDGLSDYWVDISTQTIAANTATPNTYVGDVFGANISFSGTITGSVGYLLERANIVATVPPAVTNLDLLTAPILYFTSNSNQNITANIRGNSTISLNSLLSIGQSSTFVIFVPNATAYYVNTVKVDNTTITPFWQGGSSIVSGNSNSIDIYTFAVLKTADATFKVFASQVRYQNLGP